jgi:hypothetical protein
MRIVSTAREIIAHKFAEALFLFCFPLIKEDAHVSATSSPASSRDAEECQHFICPKRIAW